MVLENIESLEKYKKDHKSSKNKTVRDRIARADIMLESLSSLQETLKKSKGKKKNKTKKAKPSKPTEEPPKIDTPHANDAKESEDSTKPESVSIKDAGGGGDCFYYSLYMALKERDGLLSKFKDCIDVDIDDKEKFNISLRSKVAEEFQKRNQGDDHNDAYNRIMTMDDEDWKETLKSYPDWWIKIIGKKRKKIGEMIS